MIMKCKITRLLSLFVVMFTMCLPSFALSDTYYSKVVANAVGEGKVYASKSTTNNPSYKEGSSEITNSSSSTSAPTHTYYVYAQAKDGSEFVGWFDNAQCSGEAVSTNTLYTVKFTANSTESNNPTTQTLYAKFQKVGAPILKYGTDHAYVNISQGTYKNETLTTENVTEAITYESSNENVATVAADGTVTVKKNGSCIIKAKSGEGEGAYILTVIDDVAAGKTQIGNGDFENWSGVTGDNHAPNNWNSFETGEGQYASMSKAQQVDVIEGGRPGSDGLYCVDIWSRNVMGLAIAQGSLTTGCLNAGATTATAKENNSSSKISNPNKSETISKVPSAIKMWVKFVPKNNDSKGLVTAAVHDEHEYVTYSKDTFDDDANKSYAIAKAKSDIEPCNDWTELTIPFTKTGNTTDGQMYILLNIATNNTPGGGSEGDHLYIDDVELVYNDPEPVVYNKYISVGHTEPVAAPIEVTYNDDNTIDFGLKNFGLDLGGNYANVGNIAVTGLEIDGDGNFSFDGSIKITAGDKEGVNEEEWIGPGMGDIPVVLKGTIKDPYFYVHLDIKMGTSVEVEAGDFAEATVSVSEALKGTFCAPFTVAIPSNYQSVVTASTVTGQTNGVLALEPVQNGIIPANTPVVVEAPQAFNLDVTGIYVKGTPEAGLLTGVYEPNGEGAPVGSYVLQNNNGKVGFFKVAQGNKLPIVGKNRCYLKDQGSNVKAFYFNEEDATAIENVNVNDNLNEGAEAIYNVAGQRINKLQKGINIINGKKILK